MMNMTGKTGKKGVILLITIIAIATISGCVDRERPLPAMPPLQNRVPTSDFTNPNLTYDGQTHLPTTGGGEILVVKMHDRSNGDDCYITYNGISCQNGNVSEGK